MVYKDYVEEVRTIFNRLFSDNGITDIVYEGPNIIVYTKNEELFSQRDDIARKVAQEIRRRIAIRPDQSIMGDEETARKKIENIIPEDAQRMIPECGPHCRMSA